MWQAFSAALFCALEVALICWHGPHAQERFYLAAALTAVPLLAFLAAFFSRKIYGGALSDANGIRPARIALFGKVLHLDLNLAAVAMALPVLAATLAIYAD